MSDSNLKRPDGRLPEDLRPISFVNNIAPNAFGSVLIRWGNTRVICAVSCEEGVPRWMKEQGVAGGWATAEYSMLPLQHSGTQAAGYYPGPPGRTKPGNSAADRPLDSLGAEPRGFGSAHSLY